MSQAAATTRCVLRDAPAELNSAVAPQDEVGRCGISKESLILRRARSARLEGRTSRRPRLRLTSICILLLIALALSGCGKKGSPQPPPDEPNTFPRTYPSG